MGLFRTLAKSVPDSSINTRSRVVGIDIGASAMKVVELEDRAGVVTLTTYGELQLGPYLEKPIGQATQLTPALERQALVDILRESAVKAKQAVLAIPLSSSFVTAISINAGEQEELESKVRIEARKYIPVPIADVALDWAEIQVGDTMKDGKRDVLIAAIQNDALNRFSALMQAVDYGTPPTEIECFSTLRSTYSDTLPHVALIDLGAQSTKLYIAREGLLERMHRVPYGGVMMTERIAATTGESFEVVEAEKRLMLPDAPQFVAYQKPVNLVLERILREFIQVIEEYEKRSGETIEQILISGSASLFPGVVQTIQHTLNRPAAYVNPFDKVAYPAFMEDTLRVIGPTFAPAIGAALRLFE